MSLKKLKSQVMMKIKQKFLKDWQFFILLEIIAVIVYRQWISFSIFFFGDAKFFFKDALKDFVFPSAWGAGGGPLLWHYPFAFFYGIFGYLGFNSNIAEKFLIFWPIVFIAPISSFLLIKKVTKSSMAGFVGSLFFSYNTYFLSIDTQGHELLTVAFSLAPFAILAFINLLESKKKYLIPITAILFFMVGVCDFRSLYITAGVIFIYTLYHQIIIEKNWRNNLKTNIALVFVVFLSLGVLNLYWLLPVLSLHALTNNEYLARSLFGNEFYNIQNSLTLFYPFWSGREPTWFYLQKIPFHFWLFPILAFAGLIINKKNKLILFFGLLSVISIFFTKQASEPFPNVYLWMTAHVPGFSAFREASKFDFLTAISYAVLLGSFAAFISLKFRNKKIIRYLFIFLMILIPLWNTKPLLTGEIKTMFVPKTIPKDFTTVNNFMLNDKNYSRILGINFNSYYGFSTSNHPALDALYSLKNYWGADLISYNFLDQDRTEGEKIVEYFKTEEGRRLIQASSIGYVIVPIEDKQTNQNIRRDLGKNRKYFEESLDKVSYLRKENIGLKNILLYKVKNFKQLFYITNKKESLRSDVSYINVDYVKINPMQYKLTVKELSSPVYLHFTELYQQDWKLHLGKFKWYGVLLNKNYSMSDNFHFQNVLRYNSYLIDPKEVCKVSKVEGCKVNKDGTFDLDMTLYYPSQSLLYVGLIISGGALIVIFCAAGYLYRKQKNEK